MIAKKHLIRSVLLGTIAIVVLSLTAAVTATGTARADGTTMHNPNSGTLNANCAGCHRIHTAPGSFLLKQTDVVALCKTCHGASGTGSNLNVDLGKSNGSGGALLGGGFQQTLINTADPSGAIGLPKGVSATIGVGGPAATTSMHSVGAANLPIWGNNAGGWSTNLANFNCANCHDPHGGSDGGKPTYRILRVQPTGSGATTNAVVVDEDAAATRHYTTTDYYNPRAGLTNPTTPNTDAPFTGVQSTASGGISTWCAQCHKAYFQNDFPTSNTDGTQNSNGTVGSYNGLFMHKAGDISTSTGNATSITCVKCHVAHGTSATMSDAKFTTAAAGLKYPDGSTGLVGNDTQDSRLLKMNDRGICRKCHNDK